MKISATEARMADVIARAFLPRGALGGVTDGVEAGARIADQIARSPWTSAIVVRLAIWIVWLAPLRSWRPRPLRSFGALDAAEQVAVLERLCVSSSYAVRESVMVLKLNVCMALLGHHTALAYLQSYDFASPPRALGKAS